MEYTRSLRIEEWMDQQEIGSDELVCACNDHQAIKRRKARYVLFKQLALEEIDKRCQKYNDDLLPGEKQAIEQAKELFSRGNYCAILVEYNFLGTFYTPLTFLAIFINPQLLLPIMFPFSYLIYMLISSIRAKDSRKALYNYFAAAMGFVFLPIALMDIVYITLFFPLFFIIILLFELLMIVSSFICLYGFCFLSRYGVLHYRFKISMLKHQYSYWTTKPPPFNFVSDTIHHVPFRRLYRRPVLKIFHDMNVEYYGFGEINGQVVTQDGINCYNRYYNYV